MSSKILFAAIWLAGGFTLNSVLVGDLPWVKADCTDNPCDDPPCCNGDVNGDGAINISDVVGLLTYLFQMKTR